MRSMMPLLTVLDIVTISIASIEVYLFEEDLIAVGTFHALSKVIIPVNAAGNTLVRIWPKSQA